MAVGPRSQHAPRGVPKVAIIATVAVALVLVGVLVAVSASGGSDGKGGGGVAFVDQVRVQFAAIPQEGDRLGRANAPIEIVEYADLQCPFCAQAATNTLPQLIETYVKPGRARLTFRPLTFIGPDSERGALAAAAAGAQGQMWTYVELLYRNQGRENAGWLSEDLARDAATVLGLDLAKFDADLGGNAAAALLSAASAAARRDGINSTPTFIVVGPRGRVAIRDFTKLADFQAAITGLE